MTPHGQPTLSCDANAKDGQFRIVACGRNYFYPLGRIRDTSARTFSGSCHLHNAIHIVDATDALGNDSTPPRSVACSSQSTVLCNAQGQVYQTGTLHGTVCTTWTRVPLRLPLPCVQVAAGRHFCLALLDGGQAVMAWGAGHFGQLGVKQETNNNEQLATSVSFSAEPVLIHRLLPSFTGSPIQSVAAGDWHGLALTKSGQVWAWGSNRSLQCGLKPPSSSSSHRNVSNNEASTTETNLTLPVPILSMPAMKKIAAGRSHSCALTVVRGNVYAWGSSHSGQCGTGVTARRSVVGLLPGPVQGLPATLEMVEIDAAGNHCISLSKAGRVFCWGEGHEGQLGVSLGSGFDNLTEFHCNKPRLVNDLDFVAVAAGQECRKHGLHRQSSQKSTATTATTASVAATLSSLPRITHVYAASSYSMAISSSGHLYAWGNNDVGQLGLTPPWHSQTEKIIHEPCRPDHKKSLTSEERLEEIDDSESSATFMPQARLLQMKTFDSNHNVLLPRRVASLDPIRVNQLSLGPNHLFCFGTTRPKGDSAVVGRTLHEAQEDERANRLVPDFVGVRLDGGGVGEHKDGRCPNQTLSIAGEQQIDETSVSELERRVNIAKASALAKVIPGQLSFKQIDVPSTAAFDTSESGLNGEEAEDGDVTPEILDTSIVAGLPPDKSKAIESYEGILTSSESPSASPILDERDTVRIVQIPESTYLSVPDAKRLGILKRIAKGISRRRWRFTARVNTPGSPPPPSRPLSGQGRDKRGSSTQT